MIVLTPITERTWAMASTRRRAGAADLRMRRAAWACADETTEEVDVVGWEA